MAQAPGTQWRRIIFDKLRKRNKCEVENLRDLIKNNNHLFDQAETLKFENSQLSLQNEKLRMEVYQQGPSAASFPQPMGISQLNIQQLEQKIYKLQEELTELHRRKGENAQQLVDLNQYLQEKDKQMVALQNSLAETESELMLARDELCEKSRKLQEVEADNDFLRDEYSALNLVSSMLDEKYKKVQDENEELVKRWVAAKAKDAELLNEENEALVRNRQLVVEARLREASIDHKLINEQNKFACSSPICISVNLPKRAYLRFDAHDGEVNVVKFSPKGRLVGTGGTDRKLRLWDISHGTAEPRGLLEGSNASVTALDFDAEEHLVVGASNDFASRIWTVNDLRLRHTLTGHSGKVMAAKFLPDTSQVITGSYDRTVKLWDMRSTKCTRTMFPGSSCNDVSCESSLALVISAHFDKKVRLWDLRSGSNSTNITLQAKITSLSMAPDGFSVLCSVRDESLQIIDLRQNKVVQTLKQEGFHIGADYTRAVFSPDGVYAACGSNDGGIFIWNVASGKHECTLKEHESCVLACCWHPSGRTLASCDKTKTVIAWSDF